ncbi:hypothetical protein [Terriglobus saanensis]|uniref:hypothetical protein n=1 Tax=Terriglobus saanensis TaxID=870903 RepID=UPI0011851822|nr:hypothetical protein [Terriglobus saanensis]
MKNAHSNLPLRIAISFAALAICWYTSAVAAGLRFQDPGMTALLFLWSLPFFAVGWVLAGIPMIAMGNRILRIHTILLGFAGAIAGAFAILIPFFVSAVIANGTINSSEWRWSSLESWPAFGAGNGTCAVILYRWMLSRATKRTEPKLSTD